MLKHKVVYRGPSRLLKDTVLYHEYIPETSSGHTRSSRLYTQIQSEYS